MSTLSSVFAAALTIGTYNVRFDVDKGDRTWAKRQPRVAQVVRRGGFDVVGFQEVRTDMWAGFTNALPEYAWTDGTRLTNPIAYRPERRLPVRPLGVFRASCVVSVRFDGCCMIDFNGLILYNTSIKS